MELFLVTRRIPVTRDKLSKLATFKIPATRQARDLGTTRAVKTVYRPKDVWNCVLKLLHFITYKEYILFKFDLCTKP